MPVMEPKAKAQIDREVFLLSRRRHIGERRANVWGEFGLPDVVPQIGAANMLYVDPP